MRSISIAGALFVTLLLMGGSMVTSCKSPFGSAGESGYDTIGVVEIPDTMVMRTTDVSLIPVLIFPSNGATGESLLPVLSWNMNTGAVKYRIVLSTTPKFNNSSIIADDSTSSNTDTSKTITTPLSYNTTYYWVVNAKGIGGEAWSPKWSFTTKIDSSVIKRQIAYVAQQFGMFIHFSMTTYARQPYNTPMGEWELGGEDENLFRPDSLNLGQWADVAKSAHCRYVVMTTKHHGGFCLWPSQAPWTAGRPHSIAQSSWYQQHGQRDICREFVDSVRSRGMQPGFYFSIWDRTNPATLPFVKAQIRELLTNYGDIKVIWFDGWGWRVGYGQIPYDTIANLVHHLNDSLGHNTIISENNHRFSYYNSEVAQYEIPIDGPPLLGNTYAAEGNEPLRSHWLGCSQSPM